MKNNGPRNSIGVLAALLCSGFAMASEPPDLITTAEVVDLVIERGFGQISEIELSDNQDRYEVEAFDSHRRKVELEIDSHSGLIVDIDINN